MTAVEWLEEELKANLKKVILEGDSELIESLFKQAKEMEKEQIITARNNGFMASGEGWNGEYGIEDLNILTQEIKSEEYYNQTFKSE